MPEATGTAPIPIHLDLIHVVLKGVFTSLFDNVPCIRCLILQSRSNGQCSTQCLQGNSFLFLSWQAKKQHVDIPRMSKLVWHWLAIQRSDLGQRQVFVLDLQAMFGSQCSQSFETPDFDMPENSVLNNYIAHFTCSQVLPHRGWNHKRILTPQANVKSWRKVLDFQNVTYCCDDSAKPPAMTAHSQILLQNMNSPSLAYTKHTAPGH